MREEIVLKSGKIVKSAQNKENVSDYNFHVFMNDSIYKTQHHDSMPKKMVKEQYHAYLALIQIKRKHYNGMVFYKQLVFSSLIILIHGDKPMGKTANKNAFSKWSLQQRISTYIYIQVSHTQYGQYISMIAIFSLWNSQ